MATMQSINNFHQNIPTTSPIINVSSYDTINNTSIPSSSSYFGAAQNASSTINYHVGSSISGQLNDHLKHKQQTAAPSYMSAALLFEKMEEKISKNVLKLIGVQKNKDNIMVATICNVIDTLVSNFVGIFDERFKFALDQMEIKRNKNNMNLMNNIKELNKKMSVIIIKMDENDKINGIIKTLDKENKASKCAEEEKEKLVEILLNEIDDIKSSIQQSGDLREKIVKNTEKLEKKIDDKLNEISNKFNKFGKNVDKKENVRMENINNKLEKMENNLINKLKISSDRTVNKLEEINKKIFKIQNDFEASAMSNAVAVQRLKRRIDDVLLLENEKLNDNNNYNKEKIMVSSSLPIPTLNKKMNNNNNSNNKPITDSTLTLTPKSPKQSLNNNNKLLIINSINKLDNNCLMEIYIDSDYEKIRGITTQCVIGNITKIIINNKNKKKIENKSKIIICHFGKIYKFFIKPKREIIIKDLIGYNANYNFMEYPYQHLYVNGDIISESVFLDKLIRIHSNYY